MFRSGQRCGQSRNQLFDGSRGHNRRYRKVSGVPCYVQNRCIRVLRVLPFRGIQIVEIEVYAKGKLRKPVNQFAAQS
jgi:hypothetical protein